MIQVTPHMRILLAVAPVDFRKGVDALCRVCRDELADDPFSGAVFVFRNRSATALRCLVYDGQGFWLFAKRLSRGKFRWWPTESQLAVKGLEAHELHVLLQGGNPVAAKGAPPWRRVRQAG